MFVRDIKTIPKDSMTMSLLAGYLPVGVMANVDFRRDLNKERLVAMGNHSEKAIPCVGGDVEEGMERFVGEADKWYVKAGIVCKAERLELRVMLIIMLGLVHHNLERHRAEFCAPSPCAESQRKAHLLMVCTGKQDIPHYKQHASRTEHKLNPLERRKQQVIILTVTIWRMLGYNISL